VQYKSEEQINVDIRKNTNNPKLKMQKSNILLNQRYDEESVKSLEEWTLKKNCFNKTQDNTKYASKILSRIRNSIDMTPQKTQFFNKTEYVTPSPISKNSIRACSFDISNLEFMQQENNKLTMSSIENNLMNEYLQLENMLENKNMKKQNLEHERDELYEKLKESKKKYLLLKEGKSAYDNQAKQDKIKFTLEKIIKKVTPQEVIEFKNFTRNEHKKELLKNAEQEIKKIQEEISKFDTKIGSMHNKITALKKEYLKVRHKLEDFYHDLLEKANEIHNDGIGWILKRIWEVKGNVKLTKFPHYLDSICIDYLMKSASKELKIKELKKEASSYRNNVSPGLKQQKMLDICEKIRILQSEIKKEKEEEIQRLIKEFKTNNYAKRFNITKDMLFKVMFGNNTGLRPVISNTYSVF